MALDPLNSFFSRFKNITLPDESVRKSVCGFILQKIGVEVSFKDISIKNGIIHINTKPTIKNEVFMRKKELLLFVKKETKKEFFDVR